MVKFDNSNFTLYNFSTTNRRVKMRAQVKSEIRRKETRERIIILSQKDINTIEKYKKISKMLNEISKEYNKIKNEILEKLNGEEDEIKIVGKNGKSVFKMVKIEKTIYDVPEEIKRQFAKKVVEYRLY